MTSGRDRRDARWAIVLGLTVAALVGARLVHLDADSPASLWSRGGEYVDEGYRTIVARNRVSFGVDKWNPADDHPTWLQRNPLLDPLYVAAFRVGGVDVASARVVTVGLFALLLVAFAFVGARCYRPAGTLLGLALLGVTHTLFVFSRTALAEVPIAVALYLFLLSWKVRPGIRFGRETAAMLALALVLAWGIKASTPLYFAFAGLGLCASHVATRAAARRDAGAGPSRIGLVLGAAALAAVALVVLTRQIWTRRLAGVGVLDYVFSLASNPLQAASPFLVAAGLLCALLALTADRDRLRGDPYRAALVAIVFGATLALPLLTMDPLRYYVPTLPAFCLLVADAFGAPAWSRDVGDAVARDRRWAPAQAVLGAGVLALALAALLHGANRYALGPLPGVEAPDPRWARPLSATVIGVASAAGGIAVWVLRGRLLRGGAVRAAVSVLVAASLAVGLGHAVSFWRAPTYAQRDVARRIAAAVPPGASVGGDWAPMLTLGTGLRSLYISRHFNPVARLPETRPDFVLWSDSHAMAGFRERVAELPGVSLGPPLLEAEYIGRAVVLYPVRYAADPASVSPTGTSTATAR